jgi:hypothetical protein
MLDLVLLFLIAAFFAVAVLFVNACERIVGADAEAEPLDSGQPEPEEMAA